MAARRRRLVVRIPGSANGLSVGSPVRFNGIPVGTVRGLAIDRDDPAYSIAFTEVQADAPVFPSTRAVLEIQGLTGAAYIELSGGNKDGERILQKAVESGVPAGDGRSFQRHQLACHRRQDPEACGRRNRRACRASCRMRVAR